MLSISDSLVVFFLAIFAWLPIEETDGLVLWKHYRSDVFRTSKLEKGKLIIYGNEEKKN